MFYPAGPPRCFVAVGQRNFVPLQTRLPRRSRTFPLVAVRRTAAASRSAQVPGSGTTFKTRLVGFTVKEDPGPGTKLVIVKFELLKVEDAKVMSV